MASIPTAAQVMARYQAMESLTLQEFIELLRQDISRQMRQDRIVIMLATGQEYEIQQPSHQYPHVIDALWVANLNTIAQQFTNIGYSARLDNVENRLWISIP